MASCNAATLSPYIPSAGDPWNEVKIRHFYNAIGFGANKTQIDLALQAQPGQMISDWLDNSYSKPLMDKPYWADWILPEFDQEDPYGQSYEFSYAFVGDWINSMLDDPLREKMVLFWSNHFVAKFESYGICTWLYDYQRILQKHALGNFKEFTREVGLCNAMLVFLNGVENTKFEPNENYARELMELFTMGLDNGDSETESRESARAVTGYNKYIFQWEKIEYFPQFHDSDPKTIFGETGNYDYDGVIDLLFDKRGDQIAHVICKQLYKFLVSYDVNEDIVNEMAQTFQNSNFELLPVLKQLLCSEHFFNEKALNNKIKSPFEYFGTFFNLFNARLDNEEIRNGFVWYCSSLGQTLFDPVDVSGWPGDKAWIDSGSLLVRWLYSGWLFGYLCDKKAFAVISFMKDVTGNSNDVEFVTKTLVDYFLVEGLYTQSDYDKMLIKFKGDIPENYFEQGLWNLDWDNVQWQFYLMMEEFKMSPDINLA